MTRRSCCAVIATLLFVYGPTLSAAELKLEHGHHISIIGNTLAERMQHDGWLETLITSRFPEKALTVRNLSFSGDTLTIRLRSAGFGDPDEWLTKEKTDVVFAFFGYNESFAGPKGIDQFKTDLEEFINHTLSQKYNGESMPQLVLFSPIAFENLDDPNLPDGEAINDNLKLYTDALRTVATDKEVPFVDLFSMSQAIYEQNADPLTINGVHLTSAGNKVLAPQIDATLFGHRDRKIDWSLLEPLRQAVLDKNFYWFHRYRTTDGYSSYGGRSYLKFVAGQTNREVMMRELQVLDEMTANRDKRIWAYANGQEYQFKYDDLAPFIPVETNKPGQGPNGRHIIVDGEQAIDLMTVHPGMKVNLFADEKMFPELINPVQTAVDMKGRLWVAVWPTYPHCRPDQDMNDKLLILEDTNGDGVADECITFADKLHNPTGFEFWNGGVLVAQAPDLVFLKDTDGDDVADVRQHILHGIDSADTHHTANSFVFDPGGNLYFQEGVFHRTQTETPYGPQRNYDACVWRYNPRTQRFDRYIPYGFANPHGHVFDAWGQGIVHDGTGANPYHDTLISGFMPFPQKHGRAPNVYSRRTRPCPGTEILSSSHFPEEHQGNLLVANVIGFQGILQYKLKPDGSSLGAEEVTPIVSSSDPNFRPSDIEIGSDGAIYFPDWHNPLIGHMQHNLRDPSRDKKHGRVYRVTYEGRELLKNEPLDQLSIPELLEKLKSREDRLRYRTRLELSRRLTADVIAAIRTWIPRLNKTDDWYEHHLLEGLWLHQQHNVVNDKLLQTVLSAEDSRARAAALKVLTEWRDEIPNSLNLVKRAASDLEPRVRLEAVRSASFFIDPSALEVVLIAEELPGDQFLDYVSAESRKVLEPIWKQALDAGEELDLISSAGRRYFLRTTSTAELLTMERDRAVLEELLSREGIADDVRRQALESLAKLEKVTPVQMLLTTIENLDKNARSESVVYDMVRILTGWPPNELQQVRPRLVEMVRTGSYPVVRKIGYVALISAEGETDTAWEMASTSVGSLKDFLSAMPLILDPAVQGRLYPQVKELLTSLPAELGQNQSAGGAFGRYVRIELPGNDRTLTLAEVEVLANGTNFAPQGKATQSETAHGGIANRALDGNKSGRYGDGGQTHTPEGKPNPWWQLDFGAEKVIEKIVVWNRTEGNLSNRLDGFTLKVLDGSGNIVFEQADIPAPQPQSAFEMEGNGPQGVVRRFAMTALVSVPGRERESFETLAQFVLADVDRLAAMRAIQRLPRRDWSRELAPKLVDRTLADLRSIPESDRRSPAAIESLQFGESLSTLLPDSDARRVQAELGELGVQVVRLSTLPHRMSYDRERIVVQAGKTVEFIFTNPDLMPHNFVITQPGSLQEIGMLAEANAQKPEFAANDFIPESDKILVASRLLQPQETQDFSFKAPAKPGVYPYVCTYPGHWRRMYGALYVVENRQKYLADADGYLNAHPLDIQDEMLKFSRPRKEWKLEELTASLEDLHGRNYKSARQIFTIANCVGCHQLNGVGQEFGPDLSKLDPQWKPEEVLRHILEPSWKINEKYQSYTVVTDAGQVITGLLIEETKDEITLVENPLAKTPPKTIEVSSIEEKQKSPVSLMPKGLLDRLRREEILDLLAYVLAGGKADHSLFEHHH
ncbi:MAG: c-type cytochrome [Planctomycetaceae bacterium]|nr:c-type cytochrome [Planctomycetaceae bacterium]